MPVLNAALAPQPQSQDLSALEVPERRIRSFDAYRSISSFIATTILFQIARLWLGGRESRVVTAESKRVAAECKSS